MVSWSSDQEQRFPSLWFYASLAWMVGNVGAAIYLLRRFGL